MNRSPSFDESTFENLFARMSRQFEEMSSQLDTPRFGSHGMAVDLREEPDAFVAIVDLPGFAKSEIDVAVDDRLLTIGASHESDETSDDDHYVHRERRSEATRRSITLPAAVRSADTTAEYNNGVLVVTLPKLVGDDESRRIEIE
jgi:HSP20 family protein